MKEKTCDRCGCNPAEQKSAVSTGYGTSPKGRVLCFRCCGKRDRALFNGPSVKRFSAYLANDGKAITNWPGTFKAPAYSRTYRAWGFGGFHDRALIWAKDEQGRTWYGTGPGVGMYCNLRRVKG